MMPPGARRIPDPEAEMERLAAKRRAATEIPQARAEFLAASEAVWREIDRLDASPAGYHPNRMSVELRQREREAWNRYRDLLDAP